MIEFEKIALKNVITHKDSAFEFQPGITVVRGDNGAGKSLLFNCIPNVFDSAPPLAKKKDAKVLHSENSMSAIGFKFKYADKGYRVIQESKKGSLTYSIEEDGIDLEPRTISIAKELMEKAFPISTNHYYSLIHLNTYRPHILLSGTGPQRKEFFEELFHLNISDFMADKVKEEYNVLKRLKDEMTVLKDQINELKHIDNIDDLKNEYKLKEKEYLELEKKYNELTKNISIITSIETYMSQLKYPNVSLEELEKKKSDIENKLEKMEKFKEKVSYEIFSYNQNEEIKAKKKELEKELEGFKDISETAENIKIQYNEIKENGNLLKKKKAEAEENNKLFEELKELEKLVAPENKEISYMEYLKKTSIAENSIKEKENLVKRLEGLQGEAKCPMCQQPLNEKDLESLIASCNNDILYLGMPLCNKRETIKWFELKEKGLEFICIEGVEEDLLLVTNKLEELKGLYNRAKQKEEIEQKIRALPEIKEIEQPDTDKLKEIEQKIPLGRSKLEILNSDIRIRKELEKLDTDKFSNLNKSGLEQETLELQPKIRELNEKRMELNANIKLGEEQNSRFEKITNRIAEIEKKIESMPVYEALIKAYSAKGIRIAQIAYLAEMFCNNLNKYSNMVFNKKMKFFVNVDANNFNIFAERNGRTSDVSQLSGQESRFFMLLCALSLIPFIPERLRCDTIILDEVEAGVNEANRKYLVNQGFFKTLQSIVKKIVIVTPMSGQEYYIDANQEYYISLKNDSSHIEKVK